MKKILLIGWLVVVTMPLISQEEPSISENGVVQEYVAAQSGLISAVRIIDSHGEEKTLRLATTMARQMMDFFPKGTEVRYTYIMTTYGKLLYTTFDISRTLRSITGSGGLVRFSKINLDEEVRAMKGMGSKQRRSYPIKLLVGITGNGQGLILPDSHTGDQSFSRHELLVSNVEIIKSERVNRYRTKITLKDGRSFIIPKYQKDRIPTTKALKIQYPALYEGEVHVDGGFIAQPENIYLLEEKEVLLDRPVYDSWSRLIAYQTLVDGTNSMIQFPTTEGQKMKELEKNGNGTPVKIYTYQANETNITRSNKPQFVGLTYRVQAVLRGSEILALSDDTPEEYTYDSTMTFTTRILEVPDENDGKQEWKDIFNKHIFLENGYVFSLSNKVMASFTEPLTPGTEVVISGRPFQKRPGEVLKKEDFTMISLNSITIDNITYNLTIR